MKKTEGRKRRKEEVGNNIRGVEKRDANMASKCVYGKSIHAVTL